MCFDKLDSFLRSENSCFCFDDTDHLLSTAVKVIESSAIALKENATTPIANELNLSANEPKSKDGVAPPTPSTFTCDPQVHIGVPTTGSGTIRHSSPNTSHHCFRHHLHWSA